MRHYDFDAIWCYLHTMLLNEQDINLQQATLAASGALFKPPCGASIFSTVVETPWS